MTKRTEAKAAPSVEANASTEGGNAQQFVIFFVDDEAFAVSLSEVKEIIRMPDVVRVPLSPPSLEGLANLRGSVLPIVSTRCLFAKEEVPHDDATRVVILDHGQSVGAVVDRVASVVTIEASRIEPADALKSSIGSGMLRGMIKDQADYGLVMIIETKQLVEQDFQSLDLRNTSLKGSDIFAAGASTQVRQQEQQDVTTLDELQLVSFEVAGQEYALPIHSVQEIVQLPDRFTRVPKADASVVGVMNLRNRLLPIVSLRRLFGLDAGELAESNRVVVVSLDDGAMSVGVVMDQVKEVLRVPRSAIDPMPSLLAADQNLREITSICRLEDGARLVSILSAEAMFNRDELASAIKQAGGKDGDMNRTNEDHQDAKIEEEQFVVFRLMDEEYGVGIESVQEIVRVPDDIASIPNTPGFIKGVVNLRGAVVPLIDQRTRFGLPSCEPHDRQRIVVFTLRGVQTGFIVDSVSEVMRISRARISPAPEMSEDQSRIIRRVANLMDQKRMILLLDIEQMLDQREILQLKKAA